jgi:hypothetical protein
MKSKWDDERKFVKKHVLAVDQVVTLIGERKLELRDGSVLIALEAYCSWRSGRVRVTPRKLAERLSMQEPHVISSLTRLRKLELLAKATDERTGEWFYLFNPALVNVGTGQTRGHLQATFSRAIEESGLMQ